MPKAKTGYRLYNDDCRVVCMKELEACSIDTVICDPPYGLKFMSKNWDHGVPGVGFWTRIMRVCKPGAFLLAFGGDRTHHRLMTAIEDAGWELRTCVYWIFGQGFPKSANISKQLDKIAGKKRERIRGVWSGVVGSTYAQDSWSKEYKDSVLSPEPITEAVKLWDGWGTALKPAVEIIVVAMKPLEGTFAQNALEHGVAGLNIDGCRVGTEDMSGQWDREWNENSGEMGASYSQSSRERGKVVPLGRWPANLILSHHPECVQRGMKRVKSGTAVQRHGGGQALFGGIAGNKNLRGKQKDETYANADGLETIEAWDCHPDCPIGMFPQSNRSLGRRKIHVKSRGTGRAKGFDKPQTTVDHGDQGSAARFFYCAKASKRERNEGLEGMPVRPPGGLQGRNDGSLGGKPVVGQNPHPTVKPIALLRYLCKLTATPTGGVVFDPFMGSGSMGVACAAEGRRFIGCEIDKELGYFEIARKRIQSAYAKNR